MIRIFGYRICEKASEHADQKIKSLNDLISMANQQEKWDPEIKFPLFTDDEDSVNLDNIYTIIVRWNTTPRSITKDEFSKILSNAG